MEDVSSEQARRLERARQGFFPVCLCESLEDGFSMVLRSPSGEHYCIDCDEFGTTCSCPDWRQRSNPTFFCKHVCWLLVVKGGGVLEEMICHVVRQNAAAARAWHVFKEEMHASNDRYAALEERCGREECPICMEELGETPACKKCPLCRNHFHVSCLVLSLAANKACPLCRSRTAWDELTWKVRCNDISLM